MKDAEVKLKEDEVLVPLSEFVRTDTTERHLERSAKMAILGFSNFGKQREKTKRLETLVEKKIQRNGKHIVEKLFELIDGIWVLDKYDGHEVRYYKTAPSLAAIIYALDRVLGKPKVQVEATEEKKGLLVIEHIIKTLATNGNGERSFEQNSIPRAALGSGGPTARVVDHAGVGADSVSG